MEAKGGIVPKLVDVSNESHRKHLKETKKGYWKQYCVDHVDECKQEDKNKIKLNKDNIAII